MAGSRPERPNDGDYYERERVALFSQGDLFRDVPLAYPSPADELLVDENEHASSAGGRRFLSGPLSFGTAMLVTPSCSMGAQGASGYGHPVRTLVPAMPLAELVERGVIKENTLEDVRRYDHLINYMYLPPLEIDELDFARKLIGRWRARLRSDVACNPPRHVRESLRQVLWALGFAGLGISGHVLVFRLQR